MESNHKGGKTENRIFNFLTNLNNQSNLVSATNVSSEQMNSVFLLVSPYYLNKFNQEGLDIEIEIDEKGVITINNKQYEAIEIKPGVKIFGVIKR
ncbi:hypothetical protein R9X47_03685 [Wukongibacter baidiensis]|uniref:hypothetical protein n=1 Tax=Wukongibacter baidiensis TaxID=1723361 RepID=UPI003D7FE9B8